MVNYCSWRSCLHIVHAILLIQRILRSKANVNTSERNNTAFENYFDQNGAHISRSLAAASDRLELTASEALNPRMKSIYWLHIEKTSTWIDNLLAVWACPGACSLVLKEYDIPIVNGMLPPRFNYFDLMNSYLTEKLNITEENLAKKSVLWNCSVYFDSYSNGFGYHYPYEPTMNGTAVTLFRRPVERIISAYLFDLMLPQGSPYVPDPNVMDAVREKIRNASSPIYAYSQTRGIPSCQTKMILGYTCGNDILLTDSSLREAKRRIREDFYFIGLTEEPVATANLFLAMHHQDGANPKRKRIEDDVHPPFQFASSRINKNHNRLTHTKYATELIRNGWRDYYDEQLYMEATKIFYERCTKYNIILSRR